MVIVRPDEEENEESWNGSINKVVLLCKKSNRQLEQEIKRGMNKM